MKNTKALRLVVGALALVSSVPAVLAQAPTAAPLVAPIAQPLGGAGNYEQRATKLLSDFQASMLSAKPEQVPMLATSYQMAMSALQISQMQRLIELIEGKPTEKSVLRGRLPMPFPQNSSGFEYTPAQIKALERARERQKERETAKALDDLKVEIPTLQK